MKIRPSAIIIKNDAILLMKYEYNGHDVYNLPGGNLEFGEPMKDCLRRELQEELQIETKINDLKFILELRQKENYSLHHIFEAEVLNNEPKLNPEHTSALEVEWIIVSELSLIKMYPPVSQEIFEYYQKNKMPASIYLGTKVQVIY